MQNRRTRLSTCLFAGWPVAGQSGASVVGFVAVAARRRRAGEAAHQTVAVVVVEASCPVPQDQVSQDQDLDRRLVSVPHRGAWLLLRH